MITIRIKGGLGNQMFQYAVARAVTEKGNQDLALDISWFQAQHKREFHLGDLNVLGEVVNLSTWQRLIYSSNFLQFIISQERTYVEEQKEFSFDPSVFPASGNTLLEGYWQHPRYFSGVEEIIRKEFTLKKDFGAEGKSIKRQIKNSQSVSVHLRRGDYVKDDKVRRVHGACSPDYYRRAVELLKQKILSPHFFVFSDDIEWVKKNLSLDGEISYVSRPKLKDTEELILMSHCKHNIIANSTFSWWAAWLNENNEKLVIAPREWFNTSEQSVQGLIPNSWKRI